MWPCHGLGDRIMNIIMGVNYAREHATPVTFHFNKVHADFRKSWEELQSLAPEGVISYQWHPAPPMTDGSWKEYLKLRGAKDVSLYYFDDVLVNGNDINIHTYLNRSPLLSPEPVSLDLPERYMVQQWDTKDRKRALADNKKKIVQAHFKDQGYEIITIGGESTDYNLQNSLASIAYAVSKSNGYIGVNSGMMWMSALYQEYNNIWFWGKSKQAHVKFLSSVMNHNSVVNFE